jgi:hypothetical protein
MPGWKRQLHAARKGAGVRSSATSSVPWRSISTGRKSITIDEIYLAVGISRPTLYAYVGQEEK